MSGVNIPRPEIPTQNFQSANMFFHTRSYRVLTNTRGPVKPCHRPFDLDHLLICRIIFFFNNND
jgi:hypothetical protein